VGSLRDFARSLALVAPWLVAALTGTTLAVRGTTLAVRGTALAVNVAVLTVGRTILPCRQVLREVRL
jgi:hypothetical protein